MENQKKYNALAIFSLLLAIFPYIILALAEFTNLITSEWWRGALAATAQSTSLLAFFAAAISLVLIQKRQQKGWGIAIVAVILGLIGIVLFTPVH